MLRRTEGIVLRSMTFGEADLIVTFLSLDFGIMKAFAKSPRKIKSRFGASLEPFTHSIISVMGKEDAPLPRLTQSDIIHSHQSLRERMDMFMRLIGVAEITINLMPEAKPNPEVFTLMRDTLALMEQSDSPMLPLQYKIRFLGMKGYAPNLSACGVCGGEAFDYSVTEGAMVCPVCRRKSKHQHGGRRVSLSPGTVKLYEALMSWQMTKTLRIKAGSKMIDELTRLLDLHIEQITSKPLRAKETSIVFSASG